MATCRECMHFNVCLKGINAPKDFALICDDFINKSEYVKRERGEWIVETYKTSDAKFLRCSNCKSVIDSNYHHIDENEFDFCPYCSADMRKDGAE